MGRGIGYRGNLPIPPRQRAPITKRILRARGDRTVPGRVRTNTERGERESERGRGELGGSRLSELPRRGRPRPLSVLPVLSLRAANSLSLSVCLFLIFTPYTRAFSLQLSRIDAFDSYSPYSLDFYSSFFISLPFRFVFFSSYLLSLFHLFRPLWLSFSRGLESLSFLIVSLSRSREANTPCLPLVLLG